MEQDVNEGVADYVLFRLQQASNHLSRLAASVDLDVSNEVQTSLAQVRTILADTTAAWLAQLAEHRSAEREAVGSNPGRTNTQGL